MTRLWLALLLAPAASLAEVPGGHFYVGAGAYGMYAHDTRSRGDAQTVQKLSMAVALEATWEEPRWAVTADVMVGGLARFTATRVGVRGAWIPLQGPISPYVGGGFAYLRQSLDTDLALSPSFANDGAALVLEAGALFFRDNAHFRLALSLQYVEPFFKLQDYDSAEGAKVRLTLFGGRIQF